MATYDELYLLSQNGPLKNKVTVACLMAAEMIRTELTSVPNHAARLVWARKALENPDEVAVAALRAALVQSSANSVAQINGATDAALQIAVNNAIDLLTV